MRRAAVTIFLAASLLVAGGYVSPAVRYYETFATLSAARTLRTHGMPFASLPFYTLAMTGSPEAAMIPQARGLAYQTLGQHAAAIEDFSASLRLDANDIETYRMRAKSLAALSLHGDAIADYTKVISFADGKDRPYAYFLRGSSQFKLKRYGDARRDFATSIEGLPAWPYGYLLLAKAEVEAGDANAALATLDKGEVMACKRERAPRACSEQFPKLRQLIEKQGAKG